VVRPLAFVVAPRLTAAHVIAALREHLEPVFVPRRVVHVDVLPREATGKLSAAVLRQFAQAQMEVRVLEQVAAQTAAQTAAQIAPGVRLDADGSAQATWPVAVDHPAFAGHFPGRPLLPGVVLLSLVMETLAQAPALQARLGATPQIDNVKFLAPVGPGAMVLVILRPTAQAGSSAVAFELRCGTQTVARGQLNHARQADPA